MILEDEISRYEDLHRMSTTQKGQFRRLFSNNNHFRYLGDHILPEHWEFGDRSKPCHTCLNSEAPAIMALQEMLKATERSVAKRLSDERAAVEEERRIQERKRQAKIDECRCYNIDILAAYTPFLDVLRKRERDLSIWVRNAGKIIASVLGDYTDEAQAEDKLLLGRKEKQPAQALSENVLDHLFVSDRCGDCMESAEVRSMVALLKDQMKTTVQDPHLKRPLDSEEARDIAIMRAELK
ncbi:hypothetical protein BJ508DRAFT_324049 [Ascobolus immersus RN42]|uniref:Uncharacterized protein n=1 Tax=Ascobolus immersus RN42 TaxID=1160509 RepID=A0A3N4ID60_ASCIM|nr:hypothetical protein BJ508DRAFT_324049 [Ascobolus immersus RN42]